MNEWSCLSVHNLIKAVSSENLSKRSILNCVKISWSTGGRLKFYKQKVYLLLMLIHLTLLSHDMNEEYRKSFACFFPENDSESHIWSSQIKKTPQFYPWAKSAEMPCSDSLSSRYELFHPENKCLCLLNLTRNFRRQQTSSVREHLIRGFSQADELLCSITVAKGTRSRILYSLDSFLPKRSSPTYIGRKTISFWTNGKKWRTWQNLKGPSR